jgi:hypothetical protein
MSRLVRVVEEEAVVVAEAMEAEGEVAEGGAAVEEEAVVVARQSS